MSWSGILKRPLARVIPSQTSDERDLLARSASRELQAFERLYRLYQPRLVRFLTTVLNRQQLIEEVLDDTMKVVWRTAECPIDTVKTRMFHARRRLKQAMSGSVGNWL